jgi:hypothetical protein
MYLLFLYTVLTYMDNQVHILGLVPQDFATKGYVHRKLHEVITWILILRLDFCRNVRSQQCHFEPEISCIHSNQLPHKFTVWTQNSAECNFAQGRPNSRLGRQHSERTRSRHLPPRKLYRSQGLQKTHLLATISCKPGTFN